MILKTAKQNPNFSMNILFVTYDFPYPITSGGKNRSYNLIKNTADNVNIFLYSFVRDDFNSENVEEIKKLGVKEVYVHKRKKLKKIGNITNTVLKNSSIFKTLYYEEKVENELRDIVTNQKIDIVHFESSYTGFYVNSGLSRMHVKKILGTENIEFMLYEDLASKKNLLLRPVIKYQAKRLKKEELEMAKNADSVITVTKAESDILNSLIGKKAEIVANGIDPKELSFSFSKKLRNNILFVGNFTYFPNIDAMNFFVNKVFPKLNPDVTLTIVGKKVHAALGFDDPRIIKKDFVDDLISEYRNADILVFPVRIGGGTNYKVLEAMSLGIPIVAYPDRLKGLNAKKDEHFLEAYYAEDFVKQIKKLMNDDKLREAIAINGRKLVEKNFNWEKISDDLLRVWKNTL